MSAMLARTRLRDRLLTDRVMLPLISVGSAIVGAYTLGGGGLTRLAIMAFTGLAVVLAAAWWFPMQIAAFLPVFILPDQTLKLFAYEVVLGFVAGGLVIVAWKRRAQWALRFELFEILVWALLAWAIATVFWVFDWWWWLFSVRKMLIGAIALWTSMRLVRYVPHQRFLTGISLAACGLSVLTFFTAAAYGFFASAHADSLRGGATDLGWGDANFIAAILVLMLPTGLFLAMTAKGIPRYIAILSILLTAAVIALTASRGGALLVLGIVLYVVFRSHIKLQYAIPIGIVAILLMIFGPGGSDLLARFSDPKDFLSIVIRLMFFREAWHRVQDYWPLGMGWGQGIVYSDRLFGEDPHNYLLVLGAELGLVGLVLWFTLQFVLWRRIVRVIHDPRTEMIGRTLQLMWAISLLNLMFEPTFQGLQYHFLFYWILGGYIGMAKLMTEEPSPARAPAPAT